jgi:hypothetical protein
MSKKWQKTGMSGGKGWYRYLEYNLTNMRKILPNYDWKMTESKAGVRTIWSRKKK